MSASGIEAAKASGGTVLYLANRQTLLDGQATAAYLGCSQGGFDSLRREYSERGRYAGQEYRYFPEPDVYFRGMPGWYTSSLDAWRKNVPARD